MYPSIDRIRERTLELQRTAQQAHIERELASGHDRAGAVRLVRTRLGRGLIDVGAAIAAEPAPGLAVGLGRPTSGTGARRTTAGSAVADGECGECSSPAVAA
jgi:hypothetical protein